MNFDFDIGAIFSYILSSAGMIFAIGLILFYRFVLRVPEGQEAVLNMMDVVKRDKNGMPIIKEAGIHLKWPWISATKISVKIRTIDLPKQVIPSSDGINFTIDGSVRCVVTNSYAALYSIENIVSFITEEVMNAIRRSGGNIDSREFVASLPDATNEITQLTIFDKEDEEIVVVRIIGISLSGIEPVDKDIVNAHKRVNAAKKAAEEIGLDVEDPETKKLILALALGNNTASANGALTLASRSSAKK